MSRETSSIQARMAVQPAPQGSSGLVTAMLVVAFLSLAAGLGIVLYWQATYYNSVFMFKLGG